MADESIAWYETTRQMACVVEGILFSMTRTYTNPVFHVLEAGEQAAEVLSVGPARLVGKRLSNVVCPPSPPTLSLQSRLARILYHGGPVNLFATVLPSCGLNTWN